MIKFFIEISYWSAYFMKWKSEKEINFFLGVFYLIVMLSVNLMTIMAIIQLYSPLTLMSDFLGIFPEGFIKKENKGSMYIYAMPLFLLVAALISKLIYHKIPKRDIFRHFKIMSPQRQSIGKLMFVAYSLGTVIVLLIFGSMYTNKMYPEKNEVSPNTKHRLELMLKELNEKNATDTLNLH